MPYMTHKLCKYCNKEKELEEFRFKRETKRPKGFYLSICILCEKDKFKEYQKQNLERFRIINRKAYLKKVGNLSRRSTLEMTEDLRRQWRLEKSNKRCTRAKQARVSWDLEFTNFVYKEAHSLRILRNSLLGFEWHVDHIIPLKGKNVCGLHVWNNFAVIPKVNNLRKGNYYPVHV